MICDKNSATRDFYDMGEEILSLAVVIIRFFELLRNGSLFFPLC